MEHLPPETLAGLVAHPDDFLDVADHRHLASCEVCRTEVDELRHTAEIARQVPPGALQSPPPAVWARIATELDLDVTGRPDHAAQRPAPVDRPTSRRNVVLAAAAAAVALTVGLGAGLLIADRTGESEPASRVTARLEPLPGKSGEGTAELTRTDGVDQLRIVAYGLAEPDGFYEAWLVNDDGQRLVALGNLPAAGDGSFDVPAGLLDSGYRIVDVSLEPLDGDPAHSQVSVIRGTLPS